MKLRWVQIAALSAGLLLLAACGGTSHPFIANLTVGIWRAPPQGLATYSLLCPSGDGSFPDAATACKRLASNAEMLNPPKMTATCFGGPGIPPEINVTGTANDKRVNVAMRSCDGPPARAGAARNWEALLDPPSG